MTPDAVTYKIDRLGHQGDGIAPGPVFAPRTLPGEEVTGKLVGDRLREIRILEPSADRVRPPCPHFKACGGCQLQHAADSFVAGWKRQVIATALAARGLDTDLRPTVTSPPRSRRRAVLSARRTKKGALVGFHAPASDLIVDIPDCHLLLPDLLALRPAVAALARLGASRSAELSVTVTQSLGGADVLVRGGKPLDGPLRIGLAAEAERSGLARLAWEDEVVVTLNAPEQPFGPARVAPPPGAFLQATREGESALLGCVRDTIGPASKVLDLFAGAGTFTLPLATVAEVHAVEGDAAMLAALDRGWRHATGLRRVTHEVRDLFRRPLMADELRRFDAVVIDPPRAGAEAQVAELAQADIGQIAFVSCNPVTFARDAEQLTRAGYRLDWVQPVDQFRWSAHIELAAQFTKC